MGWTEGRTRAAERLIAKSVENGHVVERERIPKNDGGGGLLIYWHSHRCDGGEGYRSDPLFLAPLFLVLATSTLSSLEPKRVPFFLPG